MKQKTAGIAVTGALVAHRRAGWNKQNTFETDSLSLTSFRQRSKP